MGNKTQDVSLFDEDGVEIDSTNPLSIDIRQVYGSASSPLTTKAAHNISRSNVWERYTLTTTTTTADQIIGTYTVTNNETLSLCCFVLVGERTTPVNTNQILGNISIQYTINGSSWVTMLSHVLRSGIVGKAANMISIALPVDCIKLLGTGTLGLRAIVTPADTTSTDWQFVLIGFEFT